MTDIQLTRAANALLRKAGYSLDGSKAKSVSCEQKVFEKFTIIKTPMGNRR